MLLAVDAVQRLGLERRGGRWGRRRSHRLRRNDREERGRPRGRGGSEGPEGEKRAERPLMAGASIPFAGLRNVPLASGVLS
jgi:hypothetical protein